MRYSNIILAGAIAVILSACSSSNVKSFRADYATFSYLKKENLPTINLGTVRMPKGDTNSILCRMAGNVYLPNKMTYSQYIHEALQKVLVTADKYDDTPHAAHTLSIELHYVTFNSLNGTWIINGDVMIDNKQPYPINTVTKFGTSYDAGSACNNAANAFEDAVTDFIKATLAKVK